MVRARIITIDGPAGAGKSTIAREVARRLGLRYLDTGAMYRAATLHAMRSGVRLEDPAAVAGAVAGMALEVELPAGEPTRVKLDGHDVSDAIRTPEVTRNIHYVADVTEVRAQLVLAQREIAAQGGLVTEGRDQGTVVFPHATLKVYLYASPEVRARRRFEELTARGMDVLYADVLRDVVDRDRADMDREVGPLRKAADAVEFDSSDMTPAQVVDAVVELAERAS